MVTHHTTVTKKRVHFTNEIHRSQVLLDAVIQITSITSAKAWINSGRFIV